MKSAIYDYPAVERLLLNVVLLDLKCVSAYGSSRNGPTRYLKTGERAGYGSTSSGINQRTATHRSAIPGCQMTTAEIVRHTTAASGNISDAVSLWIFLSEE